LLLCGQVSSDICGLAKMAVLVAFGWQWQANLEARMGRSPAPC